MSKYKSRGEAIRDLRRQMGLSQEELARKLDTTKQTIYKYESGIVTNIPSDKIEAMSIIFKVSPALIMGWDDSGTDPAAADPMVPSSSVRLTTDEEHLVATYRELNDIGQNKMLEYADDLHDNPRYKKLPAYAAIEESEAERVG